MHMLLDFLFLFYLFYFFLLFVCFCFFFSVLYVLTCCYLVGSTASSMDYLWDLHPRRLSEAGLSRHSGTQNVCTASFLFPFPLQTQIKKKNPKSFSFNFRFRMIFSHFRMLHPSYFIINLRKNCL